jgi:hypothetical protein
MRIYLKHIGILMAVVGLGFTNGFAQPGTILNSAPHVGGPAIDITVDDNGDVYVLDLFTGQVEVYSETLAHLRTFAHPFGTTTTTGITFNKDSGDSLFILSASPSDGVVETDLSGSPIGAPFLIWNPGGGLLSSLAYDQCGAGGGSGLWYLDATNNLVIDATGSGNSFPAPGVSGAGGIDAMGHGLDITGQLELMGPTEAFLTTKTGTISDSTPVPCIGAVARVEDYDGTGPALYVLCSDTIYVVEAGAQALPCDPGQLGPTCSVTVSTPEPATTSQIAGCVHIDMRHHADPLGSYGAELSWDPTVLDYVSSAGGDVPFHDPMVNTDDVGLGLLSFADADAGGAGGKVYVFCGQFDVVGAADSSSTIDLEMTSIFTAGTFIELSPPAVPLSGSVDVILECTIGDVNGDGLINSGDALIILTHGIGLPIPPELEERLAAGCGDADGEDTGDPCNCCGPSDPGEPGCDCEPCAALICSGDPFCCDVEWDHICADAADQLCTCCPGQDPGVCSEGADSADANVILSFEVGLDVSGNPIDSSNATMDECADCSSDRGRSCGSGGGLNPPGGTVRAEVLTDSASRLDARQSFEARIVVDTRSAGVPLGSYTARLEWDPEVLEFVGATGGSTPGFQSPMMNLTQVSTGLLRFTDANPFGASGEVELLRVQFRPQWAVRDPERQLKLSFDSLATTGPGFERLDPVIGGPATERPALQP